MSSSDANDLNRILLGSAIGAGIGLMLLALGVAILWTAADQRGAETPVVAEVAVAPVPSHRPTTTTGSPVPYPAVAAPPAAPVREEPRPSAATSVWRSVFDDDKPEATTEKAAALAPAPAAAPRAASVPRPAPRPTTPRRPPEAQRQDDSLFF